MQAYLALASTALLAYAPPTEASTARFHCVGGADFTRAQMARPAHSFGRGRTGRRVRRYLNRHPELPQGGWRSIGHSDETGGEFATVRHGRFYFLFSFESGGTAVLPCEPEYEDASAWRLDPAAPRPTAASTHVDVVATERNCNDGQPANGRAIAGALQETSREVRFAVFFFPRSGIHNCESNPPTRHRVQLDRPLGDRKLVDVGVFPIASRHPEKSSAPR